MFMAGNINHADFEPAGKCKPGKAEFNGHFPGFFFRQTVRVNACQGMNQCRLPVVDVTGSADDKQGFNSKFYISFQD
jgi:hypothetical protein